MVEVLRKNKMELPSKKLNLKKKFTTVEHLFGNNTGYLLEEKSHSPSKLVSVSSKGPLLKKEL